MHPAWYRCVQYSRGQCKQRQGTHLLRYVPVGTEDRRWYQLDENHKKYRQRSAETNRKNKSQFKGSEIKGKNLGVIGLGAIGMLTANDAAALGMNVSAYTRTFSCSNSHRRLKGSKISKICSPNLIFLSLKIAISNETNGIINKDVFTKMKPGVRIMNFARNELVNTDDLLEAIESGIVAKYVTDFPNAEQINVDNIITIPHLGASTAEAEENCAIMVSNQLIDYLHNGNIKNSVNFPNCSLERGSDSRIAFVTENNNISSGDIQALLEK